MFPDGVFGSAFPVSTSWSLSETGQINWRLSKWGLVQLAENCSELHNTTIMILVSINAVYYATSANCTVPIEMIQDAHQLNWTKQIRFVCRAKSHRLSLLFLSKTTPHLNYCIEKIKTQAPLNYNEKRA